MFENSTGEITVQYLSVNSENEDVQTISIHKEDLSLIARCLLNAKKEVESEMV